MKKWHRRALILAINFSFIVGAVIVSLKVFNENIVFFLTPAELIKNIDKHDRPIRLGGVVKSGSIKRDGSNTKFIMTDFNSEIAASYTGTLPNLFREDSGAVLFGKFVNNVFEASEILAKHDEKYMPKEVADAIKKSGQWKSE